MIIVVTDGRDFNDRTAIFSALGLLHKQFQVTELIEGGASGVDNLCKQWAQLHGIPVRSCPADWNDLTVPGAVVKQGKHGPYNAVAGHQRNQAMLEGEPRPTYGVVFPGGRGTADMHRRMLKAGLTVWVPYP
ncbi:DUF2493 domain-containing protein [Salmonella enterica]|nr:DUF2493 domain-containing protein [Salmonella enterica]